jgi:hypothetical protein
MAFASGAALLTAVAERWPATADYYMQVVPAAVAYEEYKEPADCFLVEKVFVH